MKTRPESSQIFGMTQVFYFFVSNGSGHLLPHQNTPLRGMVYSLEQVNFGTSDLFFLD
jgi:hypothetical protein